MLTRRLLCDFPIHSPPLGTILYRGSRGPDLETNSRGQSPKWYTPDRSLAEQYSYLDEENKVKVDPSKRHCYLYTYQIVKPVKLIDFSNLTTSKDSFIRRYNKGWTAFDDDYNCAQMIADEKLVDGWIDWSDHKQVMLYDASCLKLVRIEVAKYFICKPIVSLLKRYRSKLDSEQQKQLKLLQASDYHTLLVPAEFAIEYMVSYPCWELSTIN